MDPETVKHVLRTRPRRTILHKLRNERRWAILEKVMPEKPKDDAKFCTLGVQGSRCLPARREDGCAAQWGLRLKPKRLMATWRRVTRR